MKKGNKSNKGFTLVELVIVIAVISILAAVLIPTFSGVIQKAHRAKGIQTVRNMNTAVRVDLAIQGASRHDSAKTAFEACRSSGFEEEDLKDEPFYKIGWDKESGQFVLVEDEGDGTEEKVLFPEDEEIDIGNLYFFDEETGKWKGRVKTDFLLENLTLTTDLVSSVIGATNGKGDQNIRARVHSVSFLTGEEWAEWAEGRTLQKVYKLQNSGDEAFTLCDTAQYSEEEGCVAAFVAINATDSSKYDVAFLAEAGIQNGETRNMFQNCTSLTEIRIPEGFTIVGYWCFKNCTSLVSITLPKTVGTISSSAFFDCTDLTIHYEGTKADWNSITKGEAWNIGQSVTAIHCTDGDIVP